MPKIAKPRRHGTRWEINWLDADGTRRFASYRTFKEAQADLHAKRVEADEIKAGARPRPAEPHTFDELCDYWLANRTTQKRNEKDDKSIIRAHLRPAIGKLRVDQVIVARADDYVRSKGDVGRKTVHNHLTLLISMLNLAVDMGWIHVAPPIKKPRLVEDDYRWLRTEADVRKLLDAAKAEDEGVIELYATAVYTGMRAGELLGLRWEDVDFERRLIKVQRSHDKPTKTGAICACQPLTRPQPRTPSQRRSRVGPAGQGSNSTGIRTVTASRCGDPPA